MFNQCPVCGIEDKKVEFLNRGRLIEVTCPTCKKFTITDAAYHKYLGIPGYPLFTAWVREKYESKLAAPRLNSNNIESILENLTNYSVTEKQLILMRALERLSDYPGDEIHVHPVIDYPLSWSNGSQEFVYHVRALIQCGFVIRLGQPEAWTEDAFWLTIAPAGWEFIRQNTRTGMNTEQVFVAMSFAPELDAVWTDAIQPALAKAGYRAYRIDCDPHTDHIDTKIISEIRNSKFIVADFTHQRPGVYFEAGYAKGMGLPVIWCVREDELEKVHFDTRQFNHVLWRDSGHLFKRLFESVSANIGCR